MRSGTVQAILIFVLGFALSIGLAYASRYLDSVGPAYRVLALLPATAGLAVLFLGRDALDKRALERVRRRGLAAFQQKGIPPEAVMTVSERGNHFFGAVIDKMEWQLYLLDCPNTLRRPPDAADILQIDFMHIEHAQGRNLRIHLPYEKVLGYQQGKAIVPEGLPFQQTTPPALEVRYDWVGQALVLTMVDGSVLTFRVCPRGSPGAASWDASYLIGQVKDALRTHRALYPRADRPQGAPGEPPLPDPLHDRYIF